MAILPWWHLYSIFNEEDLLSFSFPECKRTGLNSNNLLVLEYGLNSAGPALEPVPVVITKPELVICCFFLFIARLYFASFA